MESVKKGFAMLFSSLPLTAIFFAYGVSTSLINGSFSARAQNNPGTPFFYVTIVVSLVFVIFGLFLQAGSMNYFREKVMGGTATIGTMIEGGRRYFAVFVVFGLVLMAVVGVAVVLSVVATQLLPRPAALGVTGVALLVAMYFVLIWFMTPYVIVVDGKKLKDAMGASVSFIKKHLWAVLGIGLLLVVIGFVAGFLFGLITGLTTALMTRGANPAVTAGGVSQVMLAVFGSLVNAFLGVLMTATFMHFYVKVSRQEHSAAS